MYKTILLPIDLGDPSSWSKALPTTLELAKTFKAEIVVMTVVPDFGMTMVGEFFPDDFEGKATAEGDRRLHAFIAEHVPDGIVAHTRVAHGSIYREILTASQEAGADLIVMASHRPELRDYLLGPNAARVLRHAACSVLVVRD